MLKKLTICGGVLGFMMFCTLCLAEQKEWTNPSSPMERYWENPEGWTPHGVPGKGDDVFVYTGNPVVKYDGAYANSVSLLGANGTHGTLHVGSEDVDYDRSLYVTTDINIGTNSQGGELYLGSLGQVSCRSFTVGPSGTLLLQGGKLIVRGGYFEWPGDNLIIQVDDHDSLTPSTLVLSGFTNSEIVYDQVRIGYDAAQKGKLEITNGTDFEANPAVAVGAWSHGIISVTGEGSRWTWGGGTAIIGGSGHAEITIAEGGYGSVDSLSSNLNIAAESGSQVEIIVINSPSTWEVYNAYSYEVILGKTGTASLLVEDGGKALISGTLRCTGTGTITVGGVAGSVGRLEVGNLILETGSSLSGGGGTIKGSVTSSGRLSPGSSAGAMTIEGDIALQSDGTLEIELGATTQGTEYDVLNVTGKATLSGALDVELINGFSPKEGDTFQIINFGTQSGCFETIHLPSLDTGLSWDTDSLCTTGTINVVLGDTPPIPTLNEWGLMLFSVLLIGFSLVIFQRRKNAMPW